MSAMVELRGVSKTFGNFTALHEVNLTVEEGEFMTFLGPSGCGKTTCLRLISGFDTPSSGVVAIGGVDVTRDPPYKRNVNQVFQSYALFPHLSIYENIAFGLRMRKVSDADLRKRVDRVVEMASLGEMIDRKPSQLSGGQRQRVALARAIVCEPKVLLLDEPLSALDARLRDQMRGELKKLQKRLGITFIFVTHDQEEALTMSDRIAVIHKGRVEQVGPVSDIYYRPATRFVASFIGETNILSAEILGRDANGLRCRVEGGLEIIVAEPAAPLPSQFLVSLRPEKIHLFRTAPEGLNVFPVTVLEEIFKGAVDEFTVKAQGDLELGAMRANDGRDDQDFAPGEQVFARIHPAEVSIVSA